MQGGKSNASSPLLQALDAIFVNLPDGAKRLEFQAFPLPPWTAPDLFPQGETAPEGPQRGVALGLGPAAVGPGLASAMSVRIGQAMVHLALPGPLWRCGSNPSQ